MASLYPGALDSFTSKTDNTDTILASHVNDVQNAIVAVQTELGTNPAGDYSNLVTRLNNSVQNTGWISANQTWTYASASTITVPSGAAAIYSKGDKIRINQSGYKYFYVVGVADTLLTVVGGDVYTVANAAIVDPCYSKATSPVGFPEYFVWSTGCNPQGFTGSPTSSFVFSIEGGRFIYHVSIGGTSNADTFTCTLPVTVAVACQMLFRAQDNTSTYTNGLAVPDTTTLTFYPTVAAGTWTASNTKSCLVAGGFFWI